VSDNLSLEHNRILQDIREGYPTDIIRALVSALEVKDYYVKGHSDAVARYAVAIARRLKIPLKEIEIIEAAAMLHDIGKIGIHEGILNKPEKLDSKEMKTHPEMCLKILNDVSFPWDIKPIIYAHHERYDGKGYPRGLKGDEIPLGAKIIAVADTYDAMTSDRAYRKSLDKEAAIKELKRCSGTQFDPKLVDIFIGLIKR